MENQLDPQVVNLAKAIRQAETGGDFTAKGSSGEYGGYQFTKPTWDSYSKQYGINTPLEQATPEQQNAVAYNKIKEWKDKGHDVTQIASMWNAGEGKPDAYKDNVGVNKYGVKYNTPKYAESVAKAYLTLKGGGDVGVDANNPSSTTGTQTEQPKQGIGTKIFNALTQSEANLGQDIGRGILGGDKYFKEIQDKYTNNIKTLTDLATKQTDPAKKQQYLDLAKQNFEAGQKVGVDFKGRNWEQIAGDVLGTALDVGTTISGLGAVKSLEGLNAGQKIMKGATTGAKFGGAYGLTSGLQEGKDISGVLQSGATGGALGGATGGLISGAGELVNKIGEMLPQRFVAGVFGKGSNEKTIQYAIDKGLSSPKKMLAESDKSITELGNTLGKVLTKPEFQGVRVTADDLLPKVMQDFPNAGLNPEEISKKLMSIVPNQKTLIEKLSNGEGLTLKELQTLKHYVGKVSFKKSPLDDIVVKSGKEIGSSFFHSVKDYMIQKDPTLEPLLNDLAKEYPLNEALQKVIRNKNKSKIFTLRDLMALIAGMSTAGPIGAGIAYGGEKLLTSPTANLKVAGLISKLANNPTLEKAGQVGILGSTKLENLTR